jgi:2-phosphosulfolactate phosphatase
MKKTIAIDYLPESVTRYQDDYAVVAIDVIRATTAAITAVAMSRACFPVSSIQEALRVAGTLDNALLAGEQEGVVPVGFHMDNSPAELALREDVWRPVVLLSSSGTRLICNGTHCKALYVACLRNYSATARHLADCSFERIAVIGAGSRGEFREEDQMACAWITERLFDLGYGPANQYTKEIVDSWSGAQPEAFLHSKSVNYLKRANKLCDLNFILDHIDDLDNAFVYSINEVVPVTAAVSVAVLSSVASSNGTSL